jgi:hypothetical protein
MCVGILPARYQIGVAIRHIPRQVVFRGRIEITAARIVAARTVTEQKSKSIPKGETGFLSRAYA